MAAPKRKFVYPKATGRPWKEALQRELARQDGPLGKSLDRIARIVVMNALNGDLECIAEIANRMDGKPGIQLDPVSEQKLDKLIVQWGGTAPPKVLEHIP